MRPFLYPFAALDLRSFSSAFRLLVVSTQTLLSGTENKFKNSSLSRVTGFSAVSSSPGTGPSWCTVIMGAESPDDKMISFQHLIVVGIHVPEVSVHVHFASLFRHGKHLARRKSSRSISGNETS
jgi:hypothetical protein